MDTTGTSTMSFTHPRKRKPRTLKGTSHFTCCVPLCDNDSRKQLWLSFHRIPKNTRKRKIWIQKIRRDPGKYFKITGNTRVCGEHFHPSEITRTVDGRHNLQGDAYPRFFYWTKSKKERRQLLRHESELDDSVLSESEQVNPVDPDELGSGELCSSSHDALIDHSYCEEEMTLEMKLTKANKKIEDLCEELNKLSLCKFGVERFKASDAMIRYYTGFPSYGLFHRFFNIISSRAATIPLWSAVKNAVYSGQIMGFDTTGLPRTLPLEDELFLFLCRIRQGFGVTDLGVRFNISAASVSRLTITWANFLYCTLGSIPIWPSRDQVDHFMPEFFKFKNYSKTRVIIDCCEVRVQVPSSLLLQSEMFSYYKSHVTCKCLIGIAPHGPITFVSTLFSGSISDKEICKRSGFLDLLEPGDFVMADKGFNIGTELSDRNVGLNMPPMNTNGRFTEGEVVRTQEIASLRVHVERAIRRVKVNKLFSSDLPLTLLGTANQLWAVSCLLTNFRGPLF